MADLALSRHEAIALAKTMCWDLYDDEPFPWAGTSPQDDIDDARVKAAKRLVEICEYIVEISRG